RGVDRVAVLHDDAVPLIHRHRRIVQAVDLVAGGVEHRDVAPEPAGALRLAGQLAGRVDRPQLAQRVRAIGSPDHVRVGVSGLRVSSPVYAWSPSSERRSPSVTRARYRNGSTLAASVRHTGTVSHHPTCPCPRLPSTTHDGIGWSL